MGTKMSNGIRVELTAEEQTAHEAAQATAQAAVQVIKDAQVIADANRASVKAKLEALGLTVDEINDTFGLSAD